METQREFEDLRRETSSWWYLARRKRFRDALAQAACDRRETTVLDVGCSAALDLAIPPQLRVLNAHSSLATLAFHQLQGRRNLVCTTMDEFAFSSGIFDAV